VNRSGRGGPGAVRRRVRPLTGRRAHSAAGGGVVLSDHRGGPTTVVVGPPRFKFYNILFSHRSAGQMACRFADFAICRPNFDVINELFVLQMLRICNR